MTHRIEPFLLIWLTEWNPSFQFDSKNWTCFKILLKELNPFQHMTLRIEHFFNRTFSLWLKGWKFSTWLEELNPFLIWPEELTFLVKMIQIFDPFLNMTQRIELFSSDSNNWALFWKKKKKTKGSKCSICFEELNPFFLKSNIWTLFEHDSKNWTFFFKYDSKDWTCFFEYDSKNWTFLI